MDNKNFFDFTDFFTLLKDSMRPSILKEELFEHLLAKLYRDANRNPFPSKTRLTTLYPRENHSTPMSENLPSLR